MTGRLFHLAPGKCNAPEPLRGPPSPRFNAVPYCGVCGGLGVWGKGGRQGRREPGAKWNRDGWTMDAVYFGCYLIRFGSCVAAVRQDAAGSGARYSFSAGRQDDGRLPVTPGESSE